MAGNRAERLRTPLSPPVGTPPASETALQTPGLGPRRRASWRGRPAQSRWTLSRLPLQLERGILWTVGDDLWQVTQDFQASASALVQRGHCGEWFSGTRQQYRSRHRLGGLAAPSSNPTVLSLSGWPWATTSLGLSFPIWQMEMLGSSQANHDI